MRYFCKYAITQPSGSISHNVSILFHVSRLDSCRQWFFMSRASSKNLDGKMWPQRSGASGFSCEPDIFLVSSGLIERVKRMKTGVSRFLFWEGLLQSRFCEMPLLLHSTFSIHSTSGDWL